MLITDDVDPSLIEGLKALGYICDYEPDISLDQTEKVVSTYEGIVINTKIKAYKSFLDKSDNLRFIARLGSGLEIIDVERAKQLGIYVLSAPEGNCNAVAEHALGMLLCLLNNIHQSDREVRNFTWQRERNRGSELGGRSVGIIGFGHTGRAFAKILRGFGVDILANDPYVDAEYLATDNTRAAEISEIQRTCDIISLHVSLNPSSHHLIDRTFLELCEKAIILLNTSRGYVVKMEDLVWALDKNIIKGACLDVYENEKPETFSHHEKILYSQLYQYDQVILTPHVAGWTIESKRKIAKVLLRKIEDLDAEPV